MINSLGYFSKPLKMTNLLKGGYLFGWALFIFCVAVTIPLYGWDVVGYVASVYELSGLSGDALRDATYDDVRKAVPPDTFLEFIRGTYGATTYEDPSALQQQIPFYKIRYVYVWMTYVLGQFTGSFSQATVLITAASGFLIVLTSGILFWNSRSVIAFLFVPPAVILGGALTLSRLSSQPDALTVMVSIFLCALILFRKHMMVALLIALLPLFRTDYIIFALAICVILFLRGNPRLAVLSVFFALLIYFAVNHFSANYGHAVIFNFSLIASPHPYPLSMPISDNFFDYVKAYIRGIWNLNNEPRVFFYPGIYTIALIFLIHDRSHNRFFTIYFCCLFFVTLHFLLFPHVVFRYYFMLPWASIMYLAEAFALYQHQAREVSKARDSHEKFTDAESMKKP